MATIFDLISVNYLKNAWVDCSDFVCASLGVPGGRFHLLTSTTAHS
jgi:hypothetical protein